MEIPMQAILRSLILTIVLLATSAVSFADPDSSDASNQKAVLDNREGDSEGGATQRSTRVFFQS
jgi:hypothetical protein